MFRHESLASHVKDVQRHPVWAGTSASDGMRQIGKRGEQVTRGAWLRNYELWGDTKVSQNDNCRRRHVSGPDATPWNIRIGNRKMLVLKRAARRIIVDKHERNPLTCEDEPPRNP